MLEIVIKPARWGDLKALLEVMVESTQTEPGALNYEWSVDAAQTTVHLYERCQDFAAALQHLASFKAKFAERFSLT